MSSGYRFCECNECFDVTIAPYCFACEAAGCKDSSHGCQVEPQLDEDTNREGLTFPEWIAAAAVPVDDNNALALVEAWKKGEDPTEYRGGAS